MAGVDGEVSFEAAPVAGRLAAEGVRVVLLRRDMRAVCGSWLALGAFRDDMPLVFREWSWSLLVHTPGVLGEATPEARAERFWWEWNALVEPHAARVVDVELTSARGLCEAVGFGHRTPVREPATDTNTYTGHPMYQGD